MKHFFFLITFLFFSSVLIAQTQRVGVNTPNPKATLHVQSATDSSLFLVQQGDSSKLQTFDNGGTSIGSSQHPPKNGLAVKGRLQPDSGIATVNKLVIESFENTLSVQVGYSNITISPSGEIDIRVNNRANVTINPSGDIDLHSSMGKVTIDAFDIDIEAISTLNLSSTNINITSANAINLSSNYIHHISGVRTEIESEGMMNILGSGITKIDGGIIQLNNGGLPAAKLTSNVTVTGPTGYISSGTSPTVLLP